MLNRGLALYSSHTIASKVLLASYARLRASIAWAAPPEEWGVRRTPTFAVCTPQGVQRNLRCTPLGYYRYRQQLAAKVTQFTVDLESLIHEFPVPFATTMSQKV